MTDGGDGHNNPCQRVRETLRQNRLGVKVSEEAKRRIGFASRNRNQTYKEKQIYLCDKFGNIISEYASMTIAAKELNLNRKCISNVLNNWSKTTKGYYFKYKGDET
jgi:S-adenosylmethionine hydrolase